MKAIVLKRHASPRDAFEMQERPTPEAAAGQVRIAVEAFGLNYADVSARQGTYPDAPPPPSVLGYEVVGRIDQLGAGVSAPAIGQRVAALTRFGGYATSAVTDARAVVEIPDELDVGIAAALPTQGGTAYYCAEEMVRLHPGDHVLVQAAAGGVGTLLVQLCKRRGCIVYGTAGSDDKLAYLRELGVDHPINYRREDFAVAVRRVRGDAGLDVVFDSLGGAAVRAGLALLASGGRIVCLGAAE
ncbi:MAG: zinc-binding dehydrogenase, partial [bacterium]